jgi:serine/threonine protein kinase
MKLMGQTVRGVGEIEILDTPLGKGGEGAVYSVVRHTVPGLPEAKDLVVKLYHNSNEPQRREKIIAMLQSPPHDSSVAWPLALVSSNERFFKGYAMKKLEAAHFQPWAILAHTGERKKIASEFNVKYALTASKNLAIALHSVHLAGHKVGDINESNIFVGSDARVLLVDTDSAQIEASQEFFACTVGKAEYTAPEISHGSLRDHRRTVATDTFAFGVAVFQMMTGGAHPTDAIYTGADEPPSTIEKIRKGFYPALSLTALPGFRPVPRIASEGIPSRIRRAIHSSLAVDPSQRLSLIQFISVIDDVVMNLVQCDKVQPHFYDRRDEKCGWCVHIEKGQNDPWSIMKPLAPAQVALPSISFQKPQEAVSRRAAPATAGHQAAQAHQQAGGNHSPGQPAPISSPTPPQSPSGPQRPLRYKGKTVLLRPDGSQQVRPPLSILFRANPKLAFSCFVDELPDLAKFWWPSYRKAPEPMALLGGFATSWIFASLWLSSGEKLQDSMTIALLREIIVGAGYVAASVSLFTAIALLVFGLLDYGKNKVHRSKEKEHFALTGFRFVANAFIYGPLLIVGLLAIVAFLIIEFLSAFVKSNR